MNRIEKSIIESFEKRVEQSISEAVNSTNTPQGTVKKYLSILVHKDELKAIGEGRGRYYQRVYKPRVFHISVLKSGQLVGFLGYDLGRYLFEYEKVYKGSSLDGLQKDKKHTSASLFSVFENLIPESDRRDSYKKDAKNLVEILLELKNTHCDFDFISADKLYEFKSDYSQRKSWISVKKKILQEQKFANILNLDIDIDDEVLQEKGKHSSLSGYQNKIDINIDFDKNMITQSRDALYLLKPYNKESAIYNYRLWG